MPFSDQYHLMIYFAVATLHFYRKDIVPIKEGEVYGVFAKKNKGVLKRVSDEALSLFNYELSHEQIGRAVKSYCAEAQSVRGTHVAQRTG
jgi:hypothetical protein